MIPESNKLSIQRSTNLLIWEPIAHPKREDKDECFDLCIKEEKEKQFKGHLRLIDVNIKVLKYYDPRLGGTVTEFEDNKLEINKDPKKFEFLSIVLDEENFKYEVGIISHISTDGNVLFVKFSGESEEVYYDSKGILLGKGTEKPTLKKVITYSEAIKENEKSL